MYSGTVSACDILSLSAFKLNLNSTFHAWTGD